MMQLAFPYGTRMITFNLAYRKRKNIEISVEPPDVIQVAAPMGTAEEVILEKVRSKAKWIVERLYFYKDMEYRKAEKEYVNGEAFLYMGRNYSLQIELNEEQRVPEVSMYRGKIVVRAQKNGTSINQAIEQWYRQKTLEKVNERLKYYQHYFDVSPRSIRVKDQKKRWASCSINGDLLFNWRCVMAPARILDYIIVHELCHLVYSNHSQQFWDAVASILPDYVQRKEWLKNYGIKLDV